MHTHTVKACSARKASVRDYVDPWMIADVTASASRASSLSKGLSHPSIYGCRPLHGGARLAQLERLPLPEACCAQEAGLAESSSGAHSPSVLLNPHALAMSGKRRAQKSIPASMYHAPMFR